LRGSRPIIVSSLYLGVGAFSPPAADFKDQPRRIGSCSIKHHCLTWQANPRALGGERFGRN